jgi:tRNA(Leu) C34 or U34 (ribose-2'-O)-methylase TrmL
MIGEMLFFVSCFLLLASCFLLLASCFLLLASCFLLSFLLFLTYFLNFLSFALYPFPSFFVSLFLPFFSSFSFLLIRVVLALDEVHDPQNLGALLRSSYYLGCSKVIITTKNSSPLSPAVSKASSGAMEIMNIQSVNNMMSFLENAKSEGWIVIGTDVPTSGKTVKMEDIPKEKPKILVLGNEGYGVRKNVIKKCDYVVSIDSYRTATDAGAGDDAVSDSSLCSDQLDSDDNDDDYDDDETDKSMEKEEEHEVKEANDTAVTSVRKEDSADLNQLNDADTKKNELALEKRRKDRVFASLVDSLNVSVTGGILLHYFLSTFGKKTDSMEQSSVPASSATTSTTKTSADASVSTPTSNILPPSKWIVY